MSKWPTCVQCLQCKEILVSNFRHDYVTCYCTNNTMVDGGYDYRRYGGMDMNKIQVLTFRKVKIKNRSK